MTNFLKNYYKDIHNISTFSELNLKKLETIKKKISNLSKKNKLIFCGNGGSSATCSHVSVDFTKNAKINSINFNETDLVTCLANDYGFDKWIYKALELYASKGDILFLLSVSGKSKNLVKAIEYCNKKKIQVITLTGTRKNNPMIKKNKKGINLFVASKSYNKVEIVHHMYLLSLIDYCIGKTVYPPN